MRTIARSKLPYCLIIFLALTTTAVAKEGDPMAEGRERHLNDHGFMPSVYVGDPFVSSIFQNHTGGGMASNLQTPFLDLDGNELFVLEGNLFFAALGLGYQQKLGSKWAVGAEFSALVRSGTNAESFLVEGADVDRQGGLWAKYLLRRTEKSQLSLGLDWSYSKTIYFTPRDFAQHIADGGDLEDAPIVINDKVWTSRIIGNWALAFSPMFAMRINAEFGLYEVPGTSGVSKGSHRLGILGEMDLKHTKGGVPLGVTLGYTQNLPDDDPFTGLSGVLFGLWYTGKQDFTVGVETGFMKMPVVNQVTDKVDTFFGIFTIRYYF